MSRLALEKIQSDKLDEFLRKFFIEHLEYERIDKDPDAENPKSSDAWRMVVAVDKARPFAIAYQANLSTMQRRDVSRLYIEKVVKHRDGSPSVNPVLYVFTDGARLVFFSADTARNRDDRFDVNKDTEGFQGVRKKLDNLHKDKLEFLERLGKKIPKVDFLFDSRILSIDDSFKSYMAAVREQLMKSVVSNNQSLAAVVYYLLESPENRENGKLRFTNENKELIKELRELHLELGMRLGDAIAAAVDTLILRYLMVRFLEAYHPDAMKGLLSTKEIVQRSGVSHKQVNLNNIVSKQGTLFSNNAASVANFTDLELEVVKIVFGKSIKINLSDARKKAKGDDKQLDFFSLIDGQLGSETIIEEEEKRSQTLGGDFYLADLGKAAQEIEKVLLSNTTSLSSALIQDFLVRISDKENIKAHWEFRYEDLRPQTLQDYYESSLSTAVQLAYNEKDKSFEIAVGESKRQRKELGAYYTDARLCRYMVEQTVKPIFDERIEQLRIAVEDKDLATARQTFYSIVHMSICDPTMGSAPFLRAAFDYLAESTQYFKLCRYVNECKSKLPDFYSEVAKNYPFLAAKGGRMDEDGVGAWELHILRQMLYGVDIDRKAVCIACQTFALSSMRYLKQGERFPSFFNLNLKLGNALISPTRPSDRPQLAKDQGKELAKLIQLRRKARLIPNDEKAYEELAKIFKQIQDIKTPILEKLVQEHVAPILDKFTEELLPFCWELEFPEVFFNDDGTLKENPGFDVVIGNPPWEAFRPRDKEFFDALEPGFRYETKEYRDNCKKRLLEIPDISKRYKHYCEQIEAQRKFVIDSNFYELQFPIVWGERQTSDVNLFKCALERVLKLVKTKNARFCLVLQSGISRDIGSRDLRVTCIQIGRIVGIWEFRNKTEDKLIFPLIDPNQRFVLFAVACGDFSSFIPYRYCKKFTDLSDVDMKQIPMDLIKRVSGESVEFQTIGSPLLLDVLEKLYFYPRLDSSKRQNIFAKLRRELDTDKNSNIFCANNTGLPLWEGSLVQHYTISENSKRWVEPKEFEPLAKDSHYSRVVIRRILPNSARRIYAGLVPPGVALADSLSYFVPTQTLQQKLFLLAFLNSLVIEHRLLQSITGITLSHYRIEALPIPDWEEKDPKHQKIAMAVGSIIIRDKRFQQEFQENNLYIEPTQDINQTKCLIDALVAKAYGLTRVELEAIIREFEKLEESICAEILNAFDKLGDSFNE